MMSKEFSIWASMQTRVDIHLAEFSKTVSRNVIFQLSQFEREPNEWASELAAKIRSAKGYLPVYRMSDGEFIFICGRLPPPLGFLWRYPKTYLRGWASHLLRRHRGSFLSGTTGYGFEAYSPNEWETAKSGYGSRLRTLSEKGILAINFVESMSFPKQYFKPTMDWMQLQGIQLTRENYFPFFFVYALLLGAESRKIFEGKNILIVTSDEDGSKQANIDIRLRALGAKRTEFRKISRNKAMFDRVDLKNLGSIDLVLIGAGVGALNILEQVEALGVPSIDAGFALDCYWKPESFVGKRAYTLPNEPLTELLPQGKSSFKVA